MNGESLMINTLGTIICFTCRTSFKMAANNISEIVYKSYRFLSKKFPILCSSDHPIVLKFCQLVVKVVSKELLIVFGTYIVLNTNENTKELERKNPCKKLMFQYDISYYRCQS